MKKILLPALALLLLMGCERTADDETTAPAQNPVAESPAPVTPPRESEEMMIKRRDSIEGSTPDHAAMGLVTAVARKDEDAMRKFCLPGHTYSKSDLMYFFCGGETDSSTFKQVQEMLIGVRPGGPIITKGENLAEMAMVYMKHNPPGEGKATFVLARHTDNKWHVKQIKGLSAPFKPAPPGGPAPKR